MLMPRITISFECPADLQKMIEQRAKQEGITRSEYIREALFLEMAFSGDFEATKWVVSQIGRRVKDVFIDKFARADLQQIVEQLAK